MALPASGQISLNDVNVELENSGTAQISMNDAAVRALFEISSGEIEMSDGYGKAAFTPGFVEAGEGGDAITDPQAGDIIIAAVGVIFSNTTISISGFTDLSSRYTSPLNWYPALGYSTTKASGILLYRILTSNSAVTIPTQTSGQLSWQQYRFNDAVNSVSKTNESASTAGGTFSMNANSGGTQSNLITKLNIISQVGLFPTPIPNTCTMNNLGGGAGEVITRSRNENNDKRAIMFIAPTVAQNTMTITSSGSAQSPQIGVGLRLFS